MTSIKKFSLALIMLTASQYGFGAEASSTDQTKDNIKYAINRKDNERLQTILDGYEAHTDTLGMITLLEPAQQPNPSRAPEKREPNVPQLLQAALSELVALDSTYQPLLDTVVTHDADLMETD